MRVMTARPGRPAVEMEEEEWLERTGLQPGLGTKLAFAIITGGDVFATSKRQKLQRFEELFSLLWHRPEECVEELARWRFPGLNLNLMQLAVICKNYLAVNQLTRKHFTESDPCDGKTVYENHPLYLAYSHGYCRIIELLSGGDNYYFNEVAAVTVAANTEFPSPDVPAVRLVTPLQGSCIHLAMLNHHTCIVERMLRDYFAFLGRSESISALGIECLWLILGFLYKAGKARSVPFHDLLFLSKRAAICDNLFLVCCQVFHASSRNLSKKCNLSCCSLSRILETAVSNDRLDLLPLAATYLTHRQLRMVVNYLEDDTDPSSRPRPGCRHRVPGPAYACYRLLQARKTVVVAFQEEQKYRTLQHEAMLTILRSVGGDPRQARTLENLPEPLLNKFQVPFHEIHANLTRAV